MKCLNLFLLVLLLAATANAQTSSAPADAPGLTVLQAKWHKSVYIPALYDDPMQVNQQEDDLRIEKKIITKENKVRVSGGQSPLPTPSKEVYSSTQDQPQTGRSVNYIYEAKIKNTGEKTIRKIVWQYSFVNPETGEEINKHSYMQKLSLRPGKTADLAGVSTSPPSGVIEVTKTDKVRNKYEERVTVFRIEYDDGTFWQRPLN
ncbi:MAG TPA: hypothetical protein VKB86_03845 [Pyrinomonadaceae bacterium]|nr:hypothetical protein [Pyrinomonadaceae bacterium]